MTLLFYMLRCIYEFMFYKEFHHVVLFLDPFLNSGVMFAFSHSEGIIPYSSDKLNIFGKWCTNLLNNFLKQLWWYPINSR